MCRCVNVAPRRLDAGGMAGSVTARQQQAQAKLPPLPAEFDFFASKAEWPFDWANASAKGAAVANAGASSPNDSAGASQADTDLAARTPLDWVATDGDSPFAEDAFDGVFLFDEMSAEDAIISELASVAPPPATMDMGIEGMMTMMNSSPTAADPAPSTYNMQPQAAIAIDGAQQQQQQQQGFFCEAVIPASARAANPTPRRAPSRSTANKSTKCSDDNNKSCKWKRRNVEKHLAGERSRRAKRMDRVNTLRAMLTGLPTEKPTVNQILSAAIDQVKQMMREQEESSSTLSTPQQHYVEEGNASITMRDLLHSSNLSAATMLLDDNHCVVDASPAMLSLLQWPGEEESIKGQYIASVMHPEDASSLVSYADTLRSAKILNPSRAVKTAVSFMGFMPMAAGSGCCAFPKGLMAPRVMEAMIQNKSILITVPN